MFRSNLLLCARQRTLGVCNALSDEREEKSRCLSFLFQIEERNGALRSLKAGLKASKRLV